MCGKRNTRVHQPPHGAICTWPPSKEQLPTDKNGNRNMTKTACPKFWHDFGITPSEAPENPGNEKRQNN